MDISTKHDNARLAAGRIPALNASLTLLEVADPVVAHIEFYSAPRPAPGATPTGDLVVSVNVAATAGHVDTDLFQVHLTVPIEGQITGADAEDGSTVTWARIIDGEGDWFADVSVSDEAGSGEIKLQTTLLYNGAYCRLTSVILQG
ncbi:MAG TPA: hypothetical protein PLC99_22390 [Verrucomicrobiota bacterium]|nr:hypothetical protein [Verrucomicrobiota bacterium]